MELMLHNSLVMLPLRMPQTRRRKLLKIQASGQKNQIDNATLFIQKTITSTGNRLAVIPEVLGVAVEGEINIPETETEDLPPPPVQPKTETPQKPTIPNFSNLFPAPQVPYQPGFGGGGGRGRRRVGRSRDRHDAARRANHSFSG